MVLMDVEVKKKKTEKVKVGWEVGFACEWKKEWKWEEIRVLKNKK